MEEHSTLKVRVFLNNVRGSLFHPKLCWFHRAKEGICLVGSGNLTPGGLRGNREAFSVLRLDRRGQQNLDETWSSWLKFHEQRLLPPDHRDVLERARSNTGTELPPHRRQETIVE